jgi:hypothetical protein
MAPHSVLGADAGRFSSQDIEGIRPAWLLGQSPGKMQNAAVAPGKRDVHRDGVRVIHIDNTLT